MLKVLIGFVWSILNTVLRAHMIKAFWAWFLLPVFPHVSPLSIWTALGLTFLIGAFTPYKSMTSEDLEKATQTDKPKKYDTVTMSLYNNGIWSAALALSYAFGWLLHHYM